MSSEPLFCVGCGTALRDGARFCDRCGREVLALDAPYGPHGAMKRVIGPWLAGGPTLRVTRVDGEAVTEVALPPGETLVGRALGGAFADDGLLSTRHAVFTRRGDAVTVRDVGSRNGVLPRLRRGEYATLGHDDRIVIGRSFLRFEREGAADIALHAMAGCEGAKELLPRRLPPNGLVLGLAGADLCFLRDPAISPRHCQVSPRGDRAVVCDLDSEHGTFVTAHDERALVVGDVVLLGQMYYRLQA